MRDETRERWLELSDQAANEQDRKRFSAIVSEIVRLLQEKRARLRDQSEPTD